MISAYIFNEQFGRKRVSLCSMYEIVFQKYLEAIVYEGIISHFTLAYIPLKTVPGTFSMF